MTWKTLEHNGLLFPPEYKTKGIRIRIRGKPVRLNALQEEMAYQWAKKKDTPYALDAAFRNNFTADFARALGPGHGNVAYEDIDFAEAYRVVDEEKAAREMMGKEERKDLAARRKEVRERLKGQYGKAVIDGQEADVANYMVEPPGIFIGRGEHPLRGRWKCRTFHGDVVLNLGRGATAPPGAWKGIVHERESMWLAKWTDSLTQKPKYVWLADTAGIKQDRDRAKYEKAVGLSNTIGEIREAMSRDMKGDNKRKANVATACYLIYRTAMRVGDEKDPDEADTVGATTLRREHVRINSASISLDFLGKDSVRWQEKVRIGEEDAQFRDNLKGLIAYKKPCDEIFHNITSRSVNAYLSGILPGLTAKVFRTYLASVAVTTYLKENNRIKSKSAHHKLYRARMANLEAAKKCNHKRTIPKTFETGLQKKRDALKAIMAEKPWKKAQQVLKNVEKADPRTDKQRTAKKKRTTILKRTIRDRKRRHAERAEKLELQIDLAEKTRDYNLGTSLRNYIDPRIFKSWTDDVGIEWEKVYTTALQKKFLWVGDEKGSWRTVSAKY